MSFLMFQKFDEVKKNGDKNGEKNFGSKLGVVNAFSFVKKTEKVSISDEESQRELRVMNGN